MSRAEKVAVTRAKISSPHHSNIEYMMSPDRIASRVDN